MRILVRFFSIWLPIAIVITAFCGLVYTAVQQNYRQSANDPQIQMAEDTANQLSQGQKVQLSPSVDMTKSLAVFTMLFDENGKLLSSSGSLNSQPPLPPAGVFSFTRQNGEERFTWQPQVGVRNATILVHYSGKSSGFILVGRSLREVEQRENMLTLYVSFVWIATLAATGISIAMLVLLIKRK